MLIADHCSIVLIGKIPLRSKDSFQQSFVLIIVAPHISHRRRRQAGALVGYRGRATSSCAQAITLSLSGSQLFATFSNGTVAQYSANSGDAYASFVPSTTPSSVTTTSSLSNTGTLLWTYDAFFNGGALSCVQSSGDIIAVFQQATNPAGCVFIDSTVSELASFSNTASSASGMIPVYQTGTSAVTSGRVLATYIHTFSSSGNSQCRSVCHSLNVNFYGTVNVGTTTPMVDCYCGDTLNLGTVPNLGNGAAPDDNCVTCNGKPSPAGEFGVQTSSRFFLKRILDFGREEKGR